MLKALCNKPLNFFFKNRQLEPEQTVFNFLNTLSKKILIPKVFANSNKNQQYSMEQVVNVMDQTTKTSYMVKLFPRQNLYPFAKEYVYMKSLETTRAYQTVGALHFHGCMLDKNNIYMFSAPGKMLFNMSLQKVHEKIVSLNAQKRKEVFINLATLLDMLHSKGIVHGAFSPDNIFVNKDLTEFRIANFKSAVNFDEKTFRFMGPYVSNLQYCFPNKLEDLVHNDITNLTQILMYLEPNINYSLSYIQESKSAASNFAEIEHNLIIQNIYSLSTHNYVEKLKSLVFLNCEKETVIKERKPVKKDPGFCLTNFCCVNNDRDVELLPRNDSVSFTYKCSPMMNFFISGFKKGQPKINNTTEFIESLRKIPLEYYDLLNSEDSEEVIPNTLLSAKKGISRSNDPGLQIYHDTTILNQMKRLI